MGAKGIDLSTCPKARIRPAVLSLVELEFTETLRKALMKEKVLVFAKVRVLDVIELITDPDKQRMFFWRDILGKEHFDYVICNKETLAPILAVELEDDEPLRRGRATGHVIKTKLASQAQFPVVHVSATKKQSPAELRERLIKCWREAKG